MITIQHDSCTDKDCLEDLQVYFTPLNQAIIDNASMIKVRSVQVLTVLMNVGARITQPFCYGYNPTRPKPRDKLVLV